ncbi:MAG: hypothetical protein U5M23_04225 [Marinagarivorans sp.]|nr:hypothetical protein [Marinagarivorans sp.]
MSAVASARVGELAGGVADWPVPAWLAMWSTLPAGRAAGRGRG